MQSRAVKGIFFVAALVVAASWSAIAESGGDELAVVEVPLSARAEVDVLERAGFIVGNVAGEVATVYLLREDLPRLGALGFSFRDLAVAEQEEKDLGVYHTYASLTTDLQSYAAANPDITRLVSLGRSVQGRELWAMLITDNPNIEEEEPEFKYISTMHGDEPVGTEMLMYLIDHLVNGYGSDSRLTALVDSTALWVVPLMNPDGLTLSRRNNANNRDLNRSFPQFDDDFAAPLFDGGAFSYAGREAEVQAIMSWSAANSFVLGANMHTGALVVNYPYDDDGVPSGTNAPTPDDAVIRALSRRYADTNSPMFNNPAFPGGITNGAAWYVATGGMQDWNYRYLGCVEVTIELSNIKKPASSNLPGLWENNRESMLRYIESAQWGVHGLVRDRATDAPVFAKVLIDDNPQAVYTDATFGDYYRLTLGGTYDVEVSAPGYISYRRAAVVVPASGRTRVDVALSDGDLDGSGGVGAADIQLVVNALLGRAVPVDCDVDGNGITSTDLQAVINKALGR